MIPTQPAGAAASFSVIYGRFSAERSTLLFWHFSCIYIIDSIKVIFLTRVICYETALYFNCYILLSSEQ